MNHIREEHREHEYVLLKNKNKNKKIGIKKFILIKRK